MRFPPSHFFVLGLIVVAGSFDGAPAVAFDKKPGNAQERKDDARVRREKEDVEEAQDAVKDAQKSLNNAIKAATAAEAREKAVLKALNAARERVEERLGKKVGLDVESTRFKEVQSEYEKAKGPIVERLKASSDYQSAVKSAETALDQLRALRGDDSLTDDQRKAKSTELTRLSLGPSRLEQSAVAADEAANGAHTRLDEIQKRVAALREKIRKEVDAEPDVRKALSDVESARKDSNKADGEVAKARNHLRSARVKLAQQQQDLLKAQVKDKQNDGKKRGKG